MNRKFLCLALIVALTLVMFLQTTKGDIVQSSESLITNAQNPQATQDDKIYVDTSAIDARTDLTDAQKASLKSAILNHIKENYEDAGRTVEVTNDPKQKATADRIVNIQPGRASPKGSGWGQWSGGSKSVDVYLGEFMDDPDVADDFKTGGNWDPEKLGKAIGHTAGHEVGHSYSIGHNDKTGVNRSKMTKGENIPAGDRATTVFDFDKHSCDVLKQNWGKPPCRTATDYDYKVLNAHFWGEPDLPNKPDEPGALDTLFGFSGSYASLYDFGFLGVDTDAGVYDGNIRFDFIYKSSMFGNATDAEMITFIHGAQDYSQFVLRRRDTGQWFILEEQYLFLQDFVVNPDGLTVARFVTMVWPSLDVSVTLNALAYGSYSNPYNGFTYDGTITPTYVVAADGDGPLTVDPAMPCDTATSELIQNVYDPLIFFKGTSSSDFVPWLATSWTISPDGTTYNFVIRPNVPWQKLTYGTVTPADVVYSLQKVLVRDYTSGPAWMLWLPIFGVYNANDFGDLSNPAVATTVGNLIESAITSDVTSVTIHFQTGKAYQPFLGILAQTVGSIQSEQWCIDRGDWNPAVDKLSDGTWVNARDPATSPLDSGPYMMGSGPFMLDRLNWGVAWSIIRNIAFWGGWSTNRASLMGLATTTRGYVNEIVEYFIPNYATRLAGFTGGSPIYDNIAVPETSINTVWQQPGIKPFYPLSSQSVDAIFFNFDTGENSPYIGDGALGELGIPQYFFADIHVRKAVAYSFNWSEFITAAYLGEAVQVPIPLPPTYAFYNGSSALKYGIDMPKAINEWQQAWGGQVWTNGFYFEVVYESGNLPRQIAAFMLKAALEAENPKFHVGVTAVPWMIYSRDRSMMPVFIDGWLADYPDADDSVTQFIQSSGYFGSLQHINMDPYSGLMDNLIINGRYNTTFEGRNANYQALWQLYHQEAASLPLQNAFGRRWARDLVHGWHYNSICPRVYGYTLWKEDFYASVGPFAGKHANWEDINEDGKVDIKDLAAGAKAYGSYYIQPFLPPNPIGPPGYFTVNWDSRCDINVVNIATGARCDMKGDIKDLAQMAKMFGFIADPWIPSP